jgi:hypothetical protein
MHVCHPHEYSLRKTTHELAYNDLRMQALPCISPRVCPYQENSKLEGPGAWQRKDGRTRAVVYVIVKVNFKGKK